MNEKETLLLVVGIVVMLILFPKESGRYDGSMAAGLSGFSKQCGCIGFEQEKIDPDPLLTESGLVDYCWGIPSDCSCQQTKKDLSTYEVVSILPVTCDHSAWNDIRKREMQEIRALHP